MTAVKFADVRSIFAGFRKIESRSLATARPQLLTVTLHTAIIGSSSGSSPYSINRAFSSNFQPRRSIQVDRYSPHSHHRRRPQLYYQILSDNPLTTMIANFELLAEEQRLRKLCLHAADKIARERHEEPVVLRFAGGWVRDKMLGRSSSDIDIVVDKMSGFEFAKSLALIVNKIFKEDGAAIGSVIKIKANPEKSKHLETATATLFGLSLDFVNLRGEHYTEHSRIPEMCFGTAEQDALRRDATVNSLFYNLRTNEIEDFTGNGIKDIKHRIIRTPMEPHQTFLDDPLRVLRCIRFSANLGFRLDEETENAMLAPEIRKSFLTKITRERVGIEMHKIFVGPNPACGLKLISILNLYEAIYLCKLPDTDLAYLYPHLIDTGLQIFLRAKAQCPSLFNVPDAEELYWSSVACIPWADEQYIPTKDEQSDNRALKKLKTVPSFIARMAIKASSKLSQLIEKCFVTLPLITSYTDRESLTRAELGNYKDSHWFPITYIQAYQDMQTRLLLISWFVRESLENWRVFVLIECLRQHKLRELKSLNQDLLNKYFSFILEIENAKLGAAYKEKPIITGDEIKKLLPDVRGPQIGHITSGILKWQFMNPDKGKGDLLAEFEASNRSFPNPTVFAK